MVFAKNGTTKKDDLKELILKKEQGKNSLYHFAPCNLLKNYNNPYLWDYIQRDLIYHLLGNTNTYIAIFDKEYSDIYSEYLVGYKIRKGSNKKDIVIFTEKADLFLITEIIEGTSVWDYTGLVKIFGCRSEKEYIFDQILSSGSVSDESLVLKIEPSGDNEGLFIEINENNITKTGLIDAIKYILDKYHINLIVS